MVQEPRKLIKIFYCYAHEDRALRDQLERHLAPLKRSGQVTDWYDREIPPGTEWEHEIDTNLNTSDIILLLISADFMSSNYCYGVEMKRALERYREGKCRVLPIILRPVFLKNTFVDELQLLPTEGKPVTSWSNPDIAFEDVVSGIHRVVEHIRKTEDERTRQAEMERAKKAEQRIEAERAKREEKTRQSNAPVQQPQNKPSSQQQVASPGVFKPSKPRITVRSIFISHIHKDRAFANEIKARLTDKIRLRDEWNANRPPYSFRPPSFSQPITIQTDHELKGSPNWQKKLDDWEKKLDDLVSFRPISRPKPDYPDKLIKAIEQCQVLLVVLSPEALSSVEIHTGYNYAQKLGKLVIPLKYKTCPTVPPDLSNLESIDFTNTDTPNDLYKVEEAVSKFSKAMRALCVLCQIDPY